MSVEKERPWWFGKPSQEGRYEVTVEDPFNGERTVSIAFCTRGGRLLGPSPSMKVVAWREVAEPYREAVTIDDDGDVQRGGDECESLFREVGVKGADGVVRLYLVDMNDPLTPSFTQTPWGYYTAHETRFYVNGQDFYTDEKSIRAGDLRSRVKEQGLPLNSNDAFIFLRTDPTRPGGRYVEPNETITMLPDMRIEIDDLPF